MIHAIVFVSGIDLWSAKAQKSFQKKKFYCFNYATVGQLHQTSISVYFVIMQHDPDDKECAPVGVKWNFSMFAKATSGDRPNNYKFSHCSLKSIKANVDSKRNDQNRGFCFISVDKPLCGNKLVEDKEQCDCGDEKTCKETCCNPAGKPNECRLTTDSVCSPSQGIL